MAQFLKQSADVFRRSFVQKARVPVSVLRPNGYLEEELKEMFEEWMIEYNKTYHSLEEKDKRFQIFSKKAREMADDNLNLDDPFNMRSIDQFTDRTYADFIRPRKWKIKRIRVEQVFGGLEQPSLS